MSNHPSETFKDSRQMPPDFDPWSAIAAAQSLPGQLGTVGEAVAADSRRLQEQGLLGAITLTSLNQNFRQIDQSGNGNGLIEREDLRQYIRRQQHVPEAARDNLSLLGAQNALNYLDTTRRETLTREELQAGLKDGMLPEMRNMRNAGEQHGSLVENMRSINPDSVARGNHINIGELRNAIKQQPECFPKEQQLAALTLISDADNLAKSVGFLNRIANFLWNGNDGRFVSPESIARRAHQLGTYTGIRPQV